LKKGINFEGINSIIVVENSLNGDRNRRTRNTRKCYSYELELNPWSMKLIIKSAKGPDIMKKSKWQTRIWLEVLVSIPID